MIDSSLLYEAHNRNGNFMIHNSYLAVLEFCLLMKGMLIAMK